MRARVRRARTSSASAMSAKSAPAARSLAAGRCAPPIWPAGLALRASAARAAHAASAAASRTARRGRRRRAMPRADWRPRRRAPARQSGEQRRPRPLNTHAHAPTREITPPSAPTRPPARMPAHRPATIPPAAAAPPRRRARCSAICRARGTPHIKTHWISLARASAPRTRTRPGHRKIGAFPATSGLLGGVSPTVPALQRRLRNRSRGREFVTATMPSSTWCVRAWCRWGVGVAP